MAVLRKSVTSPRPPQEYDEATAAADARRIAQAYTLTEQPLAVTELAYALGLKVNKEPMADDISGYLRKIDDGWEIGVNSLHHPNRQRFTLAHELGHYLLHRDHGAFKDGLLFRRENQRNTLERQANNFAAILLMPTISFKRELRHSELPDVAKSFGVSRQAAQYRIDNITDQVEIY